MDEKLLEQIQEMSGLMLSKKDIATILELDPDEFNDQLMDRQGEPWKRFQTGRMKMIAQVRKSIFELAANGSSPAQTEAMKLIRDAEMDDL